MATTACAGADAGPGAVTLLRLRRGESGELEVVERLDRAEVPGLSESAERRAKKEARSRQREAERVRKFQKLVASWDREEARAELKRLRKELRFTDVRLDGREVVSSFLADGRPASRRTRCAAWARVWGARCEDLHRRGPGRPFNPPGYGTASRVKGGSGE